MHIKMHVRTCKLAKFFQACIHVPRFNRRRSENGERAGVERRRGEGKEKAEGMTEGDEGRRGEFGWGNCATAPRGDRRHCCSASVLAYICSGIARHFLAVRAYAVWRPNRGDWQFTFR